MTFVFNASPLIVLAKSGFLETVLELSENVLIPHAVADEIKNCEDASDPASVWLQKQESLAFLHDSPQVSDFVAAWGAWWGRICGHLIDEFFATSDSSSR